MPKLNRNTLKSIAFYIFMKKTLVIGLALTFGLMTAGNSFASYGSEACQPIYGGGETCQSSSKFTLDKKVLNPTSNTKGGTEQFVDNLSINDAKYAAGQTVKFQLTVTNTGNTTLNELTLTDLLPGYVTFVSGPGSFDKNTNTLTLKVLNLNPNESRAYIVAAKVKDANLLPSGQGVVCMVNQAKAISGNDESRDNSQFCVEKITKGGFTVMQPPTMTKTPATGPEMLPLFGLIPAAFGGFLLRRKSK